MCLITIFLGTVIRVIAVDYLEFTPFRVSGPESRSEGTIQKMICRPGW